MCSEEHALAVSARTVDEKQAFLADIAGQAVADHLLQEALQFLVIWVASSRNASHVGMIFVQRGRRHTRYLADVVRRVGWSQDAGPEVHDAAGSPEQERIFVPHIGRDRKYPVRPGEPLNRRGCATLARKFRTLTFSSADRTAGIVPCDQENASDVCSIFQCEPVQCTNSSRMAVS